MIRRLRQQPNESGAIAVLFALMVGVLLIPLVALALDLGRVRIVADQLQEDVTSSSYNAVAVYALSSSSSALSAATTKTGEILEKNGWALTPAPVVANQTLSGTNKCPTIKVTKSQPVAMAFSTLFRVNTITVTRSSIAIFHNYGTSGEGKNSTTVDCDSISTLPDKTYADGQVEIYS